MYKLAPRTFDKELRKCARCYNETEVANIENLALSNHKEFWASLKSLGPRPDASMPLKVMAKDGYKTDRGDVLYEWKNAFQNLYNQTVLDGEFDEEKKNDWKHILPEQMEDEWYVSNIDLNQDIPFHEVEYAISKLKEKKALGIDLVPNEVLKCRSVNLVLYRLFCLCFNWGKTPTIWQKLW